MIVSFGLEVFCDVLPPLGADVSVVVDVNEPREAGDAVERINQLVAEAPVGVADELVVDCDAQVVREDDEVGHRHFRVHRIALRYGDVDIEEFG